MISNPPSAVSVTPQISPVETLEPRPFWSVMIPTYNAPAHYLEAVLRSVLQQDPGPGQMQIEVVDDCSPNGAPVELVQRVTGGRVTIHRESKNNGLAGTWNRCIERAGGKWVHILHQDDVVLPGFYAELRKGIESDEALGLAFCRHIFMDQDGHWLGLSPIEQRVAGSLKDANVRLTESQKIQTPSVVVSKKAYVELGGFRSDLTFAIDWEMWCRIASRYGVWYEPKVLAAYRAHTGSASTRLSRDGEDVRDTLRCIAITEKMLPVDLARKTGLKARANYAMLLLDIAWGIFCHRQYSSAWTQVKRALSCGFSIKVIWKLWLLAWRALGFELRRLLFK